VSSFIFFRDLVVYMKTRLLFFIFFFFCNILDKIMYFNIGFVSYSLKIKINIKQNW